MEKHISIKNKLYFSCFEKFIGFRFFNYWIKIKEINKHPLLFSERNGYCRVFIIRNWAITVHKTT